MYSSIPVLDRHTEESQIFCLDFEEPFESNCRLKGVRLSSSFESSVFPLYVGPTPTGLNGTACAPKEKIRHLLIDVLDSAPQVRSLVTTPPRNRTWGPGTRCVYLEKSSVHPFGKGCHGPNTSHWERPHDVTGFSVRTRSSPTVVGTK